MVQRCAWEYVLHIGRAYTYINIGACAVGNIGCLCICKRQLATGHGIDRPRYSNDLRGALCQLWTLLDCYRTSQQCIAFAFQYVHVTYMQVCITRNMSPSSIYRTGSAELGYSADIKKHEKQAVFELSLHACTHNKSVALYLARAEQNRNTAISQGADLVQTDHLKRTNNIFARATCLLKWGLPTQTSFVRTALH